MIVFSRSPSGAVGPSAPVTSNRESSTHRTTCDGVAESRRTEARRPSCWRIVAGTGSVSARNAVLNQTCRRSALKSAVGVPVATTTVPARTLPAAVSTSTNRGLKTTFVAAVISKICAPRSTAAAARPSVAR